MQTGNEIVDKISTMKLRAVEPTWYKAVVDEKGRTNFLSVAILHYAFYWYTSDKVDGTDNVINCKNDYFDKYCVQLSYEQLEDMFNVSRKQVYTALLLLEKIGVIHRVFKSIDTEFGTIHNVMFLSINPEKLYEISFTKNISKNDVCSKCDVYINGDK